VTDADRLIDWAQPTVSPAAACEPRLDFARSSGDCRDVSMVSKVNVGVVSLAFA
jgi:hypothetical protein